VYRSISNASVDPAVYAQAMPFYYIPTIAEVEYWSGATLANGTSNSAKISSYQSTSAFFAGCADPTGGCTYQQGNNSNATTFINLPQYKVAAQAAGQAVWYQNPPSAAALSSGGVEATVLIG
jgi:hypothetical protein